VVLILRPVSTGSGRVEPRAHGSGARQVVDLDRRLETFDGYWSERLNLDEPLGEPQRVGSQKASAPVASCSIRAARWVVWPTAV
jgi:hypothetical protein